jgi:hypothetical protein
MANFGPAYATSAITGCRLNYSIDDPNTNNLLVKIVTYSESGGVEVTSATSAQFNNNEISGLASGSAKMISCTAQYSTPQRNFAMGGTLDQMDWTALNRLRWSTIASFVPSWTADGGTFPSIGNGTIAGEYYIENRRCYVNVVLSIGTTTTLGSGPWYFYTPNSMVTKSNIFSVVGSARILRTGVDFKLAA